MSETFIIENVPYLSQRDNKFEPFISCFPTSSGMAMTYCLNLIGKDKTVIGCSPNNQIEDYINETIYDADTEKWMKANTPRLGQWIWKYKKRTIFAVEEYVFNRLMNKQGFKATFKQITYDEYCNEIETNKLPIIIGGDFSTICSVGGHMLCGIGFNQTGLKEIIVNDPYGSALVKYQNTDLEQSTRDGTAVAYPLRFFKNGQEINSLIITSC